MQCTIAKNIILYKKKTLITFKAFCPAKELPRLFPHQSPIEGFQVKDKVRGNFSL